MLNSVKEKIQHLNMNNKKRRRLKPILDNPTVLKHLEDLQKRFVFVPTDKAGNNISIVCKKFYIEKSMQELKIFLDSKDNKIRNNTYEEVNIDIKSIINRHRKYLKSNLNIESIKGNFPFLYWIPKMHKKPFSKQRYIAASSSCTTETFSCFTLIQKQHRVTCD